MKRMKRDDIKEFIELLAGHKKSSRMLAEAEGDEEESEFDSDDEGSDEETDQPAGDSDDSDETATDSNEDEEEEEEEVKISKSDEVEFGKSLDDSLQAMFIDIESNALKSAKVQEEGLTLRRFLFEENAIDLEVFASETARIIKNADVLLDIEEIILSKARDYLAVNYSEDHERNFLEILKKRHNIDTRNAEERETEEAEIKAPIAIGATSGDGTPS